MVSLLQHPVWQRSAPGDSILGTLSEVQAADTEVGGRSIPDSSKAWVLLIWPPMGLCTGPTDAVPTCVGGNHRTGLVVSRHVHGMQLTFERLGLGWELAPCRNLVLVQKMGQELALLLGHLQGRDGSFGKSACITFSAKTN